MAKFCRLWYSQCHFWHWTCSVERGKEKTHARVCESLSETMFKFTNIIMYFAPIRYWCGHGGYSWSSWALVFWKIY